MGSCPGGAWNQLGLCWGASSWERGLLRWSLSNLFGSKQQKNSHTEMPNNKIMFSGKLQVIGSNKLKKVHLAAWIFFTLSTGLLLRSASTGKFQLLLQVLKLLLLQYLMKQTAGNKQTGIVFQVLQQSILMLSLPHDHTLNQELLDKETLRVVSMASAALQSCWCIPHSQLGQFSKDAALSDAPNRGWGLCRPECWDFHLEMGET